MKYIKFWLLLIFLLSKTVSTCCPTCIGRIEKNSMPFFSDEPYQQYPKLELGEDDDQDEPENNNQGGGNI
ncbi:MAG: hypothetical protein Q8Q25_03320 [bacterium]|nr:hypothetical protein [bacterium]